MKNKGRLDKVQGCLFGVAIGDALGMPVETMTHEQIMCATGGYGVLHFMNPLSKREWLTGLNAGDTTDDWQLTQAVAQSLIRNHGVLNLYDCANEHIKALEESAFGWGKTTQTAIEDIRDGKRRVNENLMPPKKGKGCGNGVIMKIAPIAITAYKHEEKLWEYVKALGMLTHPDIRASISALAVALFINESLNAGFQNASGGLTFLVQVIELIERIERLEGVTDNLVSDKLELIITNYQDASRLRSSVGCGFYANETAGFTIGTFLRHPTEFRCGVLEAVNAGGDTDTNASIVGALIGANCGVEAIPLCWRNFSPKFENVLTLSHQLLNC